MAEKVVLKKYANRRLYDTEKSSYVTLDQVADMVRGGRRIEVMDAKTKEDVTSFILTQIIMEEARKKNALLPVPLLHIIIQFGDNLLVEFFEKYLQQIINNYLSYKSVFDEQFKKWLDLGMDISDMTPNAMGNFSTLKPLFDFFPGNPGAGADEDGEDRQE